MAETVYPCTLGCGIKEKLMNKESSIKKQNTLTRVVCTFVFSLFAFFYLYYYQADLLTVMQHVFSKGQTHYNHFIGAVLITFVLLLIQVGVVNLFRKVKVAWALTFVPSSLCLATLTNVRTSETDGLLEFGCWVYVLPLALLLFFLLVWGSYASGLTQALEEVTRSNVRKLWCNLLVVLGSMLLVCFSGNSDKTYHARIHAEQCLINNDFNGALRTLKQCTSPDENTTMLTVYALSRKNALGEKLFEYQLRGGSAAMMPNGAGVKFEMLPDSTFYSYLGGWYLQRMSTMRYLDYQKRHHHMNRADVDYLLCGYLMDRNLDAFVANIGKYYVVNDSAALPKHYKEALLLYTHLHSNPRIIYNNNVMNADFQDYQKLENSVAVSQREVVLRDTYGNTYWYYYNFHSNNDITQASIRCK